MKKRKLLFIFFAIFIFSLSWSFQDFRTQRKRELQKPKIRERTENIMLINEGKPFRYQGPPYDPDNVLVKFKQSVSDQKIKALMATYKSKKLRRIARINVYNIQIPKNVTVEEMVFELSKNPDVEYAEPNYKVHISVTPNDTYFREQYSLSNTGQDIYWIPGSPQGKPSADIKATQAWEETQGEEDIIIAVLDTGIDLLHPDLETKILNSGRDFVNNDFEAADDHGHGTHVAGIAAAETNNSRGIAGVAWNCKILPIKVLDETGEGNIDAVSSGIMWAVERGANVINMSFGGKVYLGEGDLPKTLQDALREAFEEDIVLVASAGNDGGDVKWPASSAYCLAVAATNYNDERVTFSNSLEWESNFGPEIDVAAPGEGILSSWPEELTPAGFAPYAWASGTSTSTPHVAGLVALIKSIKPWLEPGDIMDIIRYSADDTNSSQHLGKDNFIGYGRLNMEKALVPIKIESSK